MTKRSRSRRKRQQRARLNLVGTKSRKGERTQPRLFSGGKQASRNETIVLLVGEADFSYTLSLMLRKSTHECPNSGVTYLTTSYESLAVLRQKYGKSVDRHLKSITELGAKQVTVLHEVDATRLRQCLPRGQKFDKVVFNFPHTGSQRVHANRALLTAFFRSCNDILLPGGRVEVTLKICPPYSRWDLESCANAASFLLVDVTTFDFTKYPGYKHRTTEPDAKELNPKGHCKTFAFMCEAG